MKNAYVKICAFMMVMLMLLAVAPMSVFADTAGSTSVVDGKVIYYTDENGIRTGVKTVKLGENNYYDLSGNTKIDNIDSSYLHSALDALMNIELITTDPVTGAAIAEPRWGYSILDQWANIASLAFQDGDYLTCTDNYYDYFVSPTSDDYYKCDVTAHLGDPQGHTVGGTDADSHCSTGLSVCGSLSELRMKMCEHIATRIGQNSLTAEDVLGQGFSNPDALEALNDDTRQNVIYNIVTSVNKKNLFEYKYNSYGLAFYDFDLTILADEDLEYVTGAEAYKDEANPVDAAAQAGEPGFAYSSDSEITSFSSFANESVMDTTECFTTTKTQSQSVMTSVQNSETYAFEEMLGSETRFGGDDAPVSETLKLEITAQQAYESVKTNEETQTIEYSSSTTADKVVPAQTVAYTQKDEGNASMTVAYDTPVALYFKVAIFCMNGDVYADDVIGNSHDTWGYHQSNFSTIFGGDAEAGTYAYSALKNKADNKAVSGWDATHGNNHFFYNEHDGLDNTIDTSAMDMDWGGIDWNINDRLGYTLSDIATRVPMLSAGSSMTVNGQSTDTTVMDPVPMYLPVSLRVTNSKQNYIMYENGRYNLTPVEINAFNKNNVPYYPFKMFDGHWEVAPGSEDVIEYNERTNSVVAKSLGTGYMMWVINDDVVYTAEEGGQVTSKDLKPVVIAFSVRNNPVQSSLRVSVVGDEFKGTVGDPAIAVDELLELVDEEGNPTEYAVEWEIATSDEENTATLKNGMITFNEEGAQQIRGVVYAGTEHEYKTDWFEISPREARRLGGATLSKTDFDKVTLLFKYMKYHTGVSDAKYDIMSFVKCTDQYGDAYTASADEIHIELDNINGAVLEDGILTVSDAGEFRIKVTAPTLKEAHIGTMVFTAEKDIQYQIGDVDGDNYRTVKDATLIQKYLAKLVTSEEINLENADANRDGVINIKDATYIQKFVAGLIS